MKQNRLRVVRAERRITQYQLAVKTKITQSKLSLIENSYVEPSEAEQAAIAGALAASVDEVFPSEAVSL